MIGSMLKIEPIRLPNGLDIRHVRTQPGGRWALAHAVSGRAAHLVMGCACSPSADTLLRFPHVERFLFTMADRHTVARPHMRDVRLWRSASLPRPATSSGKGSEHFREFWESDTSFVCNGSWTTKRFGQLRDGAQMATRGDPSMLVESAGLFAMS